MITELNPGAIPRGGSAVVYVIGERLGDTVTVTAGEGFTVTDLAVVDANKLTVTVTDAGADPLAYADLTATDSSEFDAVCTKCLHVAGEAFASDPSLIAAPVTTAADAMTVTYSGDGGFGSAPELGDVITGGPGANAPDGVFGRVTEVSTDGATTTVRLGPADLSSLAPSGSFDLSAAIDAAGAGQGLATARAGTAALNSPLIPFGLPVEKTFSTGLTCGAGAGIDIDGGLEVELSQLDLDLWWDNSSNAIGEITAKATATTELSFGVSVGSAANCETPDVNLLPVPIKLGTVPVPIAGTPFIVPVNPTVMITAQAEAEVTSAWSAEVTDTSTDSGTLTWNPSGLTSTGSRSHTFEADPPTGAATGSLKGTITTEVEFLIANMAGPAVSFSPGLEISTSTDKPECWKIDGIVDVGASVVAPVFGVRAGKDDIVTFRTALRYPNNASCFPGAPTTAPPDPGTPTTQPPPLGGWDIDGDCDPGPSGSNYISLCPVVGYWQGPPSFFETNDPTPDLISHGNGCNGLPDGTDGTAAVHLIPAPFVGVDPILAGYIDLCHEQLLTLYPDWSIATAWFVEVRGVRGAGTSFKWIQGGFPPT